MIKLIWTRKIETERDLKLQKHNNCWKDFSILILLHMELNVFMDLLTKKSEDTYSTNIEKKNTKI